MWAARALVWGVAAAVGLALLFGEYQDPKTLVFPALALLLFGVFSLPPVHPYVLVLLALLATPISSALYGIFGVGLDALVCSAFLLFVFAAAIAIPFGIAAVSAGIRVRRMISELVHS